jgi:hypothetical protein
MTAQELLHPNRNLAAPQHEASIKRSSAKKSERRSALKLRTGGKAVQNAEKPTVCINQDRVESS